jgi:hypothetical protein
MKELTLPETDYFKSKEERQMWEILKSPNGKIPPTQPVTRPYYAVSKGIFTVTVEPMERYY